MHNGDDDRGNEATHDEAHKGHDDLVGGYPSQKHAQLFARLLEVVVHNLNLLVDAPELFCLCLERFRCLVCNLQKLIFYVLKTYSPRPVHITSIVSSTICLDRSVAALLSSCIPFATMIMSPVDICSTA